MQKIIYFIYRILGPWRKFKFRGRKYRYFYHLYNATWRNERSIEIPIIWEVVKGYYGKRILEIGNVLSHYFPVSHDILDKYENGKNVINQDVIDFRPLIKYNLIISISTLEHAGWDENHRFPLKILQALKNLKKCLTPKGKMVVTLPLGYNPEMDKLLKESKIHFTKQYFLKRISRDNRWREVDSRDVYEAKYDYPFPGANGLVIGIIKNK